VHSSKVLILGTLPGPESLRVGQYYANPNNQFWKIIYSVFNKSIIDPSYSCRLSFLLERYISLWDVFHSAERKGALDADIRNEVPNDIPGLVQSYPNIRRVLLNGRKAETSFHAYFSNVGIDSLYVPSTSPAYAGKTLDEKTEDWRTALFS